jgi:hypothetical protein
MDVEVAVVAVGPGVVRGLEGQFELLGRLETEGREEVEVLRVEVGT